MTQLNPHLFKVRCNDDGRFQFEYISDLTTIDRIELLMEIRERCLAQINEFAEAIVEQVNDEVQAFTTQCPIPTYRAWIV